MNRPVYDNPGLAWLDHWQLASSPPGKIINPESPELQQLPWKTAVVPGTVAQSLLKLGEWRLGDQRDLDAEDWWYRCEFTAPSPQPDERFQLNLEGLATLAEVWLNGSLLLRSDNMFIGHRLDIRDQLKEKNVLHVCFRSLTAAMSERRPRPRWKPGLVANQQLRWFRTSLLGRMRGWTPDVAPVGPWKPVTMSRLSFGDILDVQLHTTLDKACGVVEVSLRLLSAVNDQIEVRLTVGNATVELSAVRDANEAVFAGSLRIEDVELWWPHTQGQPYLYTITATILFRGVERTIGLGQTGFRRVSIDQTNGDFSILVNGVPVYCRGAVWTTMDIVSLSATHSDYEHILKLVQEAGANMLRVGGTMLYEHDTFYKLCDKYGILVWQDFMFANMDYSGDDPGFCANVEKEVRQQLRRWQLHPCVTVYSGNSDVEYIASLFGVPREYWRSKLFSELIPEICRQERVAIPYVPTSPGGADMPYQVGQGTSSYYGVGAYMRPVADVRRDNLRFVTEGTGISNIPESGNIDLLYAKEPVRFNDPRWKSGIQRDHGSSYDFEDVRHHYMKELYGVDPVKLQGADPDRYLALGRAATGELLNQVHSEWRSVHSQCRGALVWFLRDFRPGAGVGLLDSNGMPKACYYFLRRAWKSTALVLTNEGLNGVHAHLLNESREIFTGKLEIKLIRAGNVVTASRIHSVSLLPGERRHFSADVFLGGFYDTTYAYKFGPPQYDVLIGTLLGPEDNIISQAFYVPQSSVPVIDEEATLSVRCIVHQDGYQLQIASDRFLNVVSIDAPGFLPDDNYFHLAPGHPRTIFLRQASGASGGLSGLIAALNLRKPVAIDCPTTEMI